MPGSQTSIPCVAMLTEYANGSRWPSAATSGACAPFQSPAALLPPLRSGDMYNNVDLSSYQYTAKQRHGGCCAGNRADVRRFAHLDPSGLTAPTKLQREHSQAQLMPDAADSPKLLIGTPAVAYARLHTSWFTSKRLEAHQTVLLRVAPHSGSKHTPLLPPTVDCWLRTD